MEINRSLEYNKEKVIENIGADMSRENPTTTEAKRKAIRKYDQKTYKTITLKFRYEEDSEIIEDIAKCKKAGVSPTEFFRRLYAKR